MKLVISAVVRDLIAEQSEALAQRWVEIFVSHRPNDAQLPYSQQLAAINHFWRIQLAQLPVPTIDERECLEDGVALADWSRNFRKYVLPTIVRHNLPIRLGR